MDSTKNGFCVSRELSAPLKWHGGKHYLAKFIIGLMPPRCKNPNAPAQDDNGWLHYVEPYAGGLSVLLANDPEGISEVVNDRNGDLVNWWRCLSDRSSFDMLQRILEGTPFSEGHYRRTDDLSWPDSVKLAAEFFVRCRQSLAGRMASFAPLTRNRTRRGMNEQASAWLNAIEGLPAVHERLKRVVILNRDAIDVIKGQDGARTLFYLDPPYMHDSRATTKEYGEFEMTSLGHENLLTVLKGIEGRFMLSGYHSELYDMYARHNGWTCHEMKIDNKSSGGKKKRVMTECVWCNF